MFNTDLIFQINNFVIQIIFRDYILFYLESLRTINFIFNYFPLFLPRDWKIKNDLIKM